VQASIAADNLPPPDFAALAKPAAPAAPQISVSDLNRPLN
jgi:hypothetical protein